MIFLLFSLLSELNILDLVDNANLNVYVFICLYTWICSVVDSCKHLCTGEQGALTMMPMFLLDQKIDATEVSFWTGIVCQGISIAGSVLGGWLVTTFKYVIFCC